MPEEIKILAKEDMSHKGWKRITFLHGEKHWWLQTMDDDNPRSLLGDNNSSPMSFDGILTLKAAYKILTLREGWIKNAAEVGKEMLRQDLQKLLGLR